MLIKPQKIFCKRSCTTQNFSFPFSLVNFIKLSKHCTLMYTIFSDVQHKIYVVFNKFSVDEYCIKIENFKISTLYLGLTQGFPRKNIK
jgi:hypothetical protein